MKRVNKQIFLFLIPTLFVALIFVPFNSQNYVISDDVDFSSVILSIDVPVFYFVMPNVFGILPFLIVVGSVFVFAILIAEDKTLCDIKNHSPPLPV